MKKYFALLFILIAIPAFAQEKRFIDSTEIPDKPVGKYVMPFLDMINNADNDKIQEFLQKNIEPSFRAQLPVEQVSGYADYLRNTFGKLSFHSVREFKKKLPDNEIMIIAKPEKAQTLIAIILRTQNDPPYLINNLQLVMQNNQIKPVLLVIDTQNSYLPAMPEEDKKVSVPMINECIELFREKGLPIIRVYNTNPMRGGPAVDSEAFKFPSTIKVTEDDMKVIKNFPSAFRDTDLDSIIKENGYNSLYLCGLSATGCVLATYFGAAERGYNVSMIKDAVMSPNHNHTKVIEDITNAVNIQTLVFNLDHIVKPVEN